MRRKNVVQMSESIIVGSILAGIGGYMDTYSYLCRGGVFANAETGNIVLLAISLANFNWKQAIHYFIPIMAFAIGVIISTSIKGKNDSIRILHWRQITVLIEMFVLILVAYTPQEMNLLANSIISLTCGIQVTAFAKFHDYAMATTMCTGNLRSGMQNLYFYRNTKNSLYLQKTMLYFGCILCFVIGAITGVIIVGYIHEKAILIAAIGLLCVLFLMFVEERLE